jgi:hypothetical protein
MEQIERRKTIEQANHLINERVDVLLHSLRSKEKFKEYRRSIEKYIGAQADDFDIYFQRLSELH